MKVLLIVLGSLFGLFVLAVIALVIMIPILGKKAITAAMDPVAKQQAAAKIAKFTIPPGYRLLSATDIMGLSESAIIVSDTFPQDLFRVQLTGQHLPTSDPKSMENGMTTGLQISEKLLGCDLKAQGNDTLSNDGKPIVLSVLSCDGPHAMRVEMGVVPAQASTVQLVATNTELPADHEMLVKFVSSIR